jgi:DNA-binding NtrC family response regulator
MDIKILLVTNRQDMVNDVTRAITINNTNVDVVSNEIGALEYLKSGQYPVMLFLYSTIEMAQAAYFSIIKAGYVQDGQYKAVLLCDHVDIEKAVEACSREIFFDYVVLTPRFDRARINLSIKNAVRAIKKSKCDVSSREFARTGDEIGVFNSEIGNVIKNTDQLTMKNDQIFMGLSNDIKADLNKLESNIVRIKEKSSDPDSVEEIAKQVNKLSTEVVDKSIQKSRNMVNASICGYAEKIAAVRARHSDAFSRLNKLSSSVKKSVLIVEDNEVYGEMIKTMLDTASSYEVTLVSTIHQGMVHTITNKPDIVFLDYELPDANASVFLERVRNVPLVSKTPVIILTSHNHPDIYNSTIMLGAQDFVVKPSSRETILQKINTWLPAGGS